MVKEAYVSFEVAKLLNEKGFNWRTQYVYTLEGTGSTPHKIGNWRAKSNIQMPTHQMAMAWLREVHNIFIVISPISCKGYGASLCDVGDFDDFNYIDYIGDTDYFFHPEEAVEAALKYSLENLI